ncbi:MAG: (d)CMP kinase, partial [Rhodospirillales bacterium]
DPADLADPALRTDTVAVAASKVSAIPGVRAALLAFQRAFAADPPEGKKGAVLDGRDIGTVVCPDADAKLFVTASVEVRAERRLKELLERGEEAIHGRVLQDMKERDARDSGRDVSPLVPAGDAFVLDTSDLNADAVFAAALDYIRKQTRSG